MTDLKEETTFVYTLSSKRNMIQQFLRSITTLKNHVKPSKIKVYYTPPHNKEDLEKLEETNAEIIKKDNQTKAFNVSRSLPKSHYGEKINLCNIQTKNVVFLDCDTILGKNIWEVLEGEFDFKARPGKRIENWEELFDEHGEEYMDWMPNAGFLIFKNHTHQEIKEDWKKYLGKDLTTSEKVNHHEQYALALAVSGHHTQPMTHKEHVYEWQNEKTPDAHLYHLATSDGSNTINLAKNTLSKIKPW